MQIFPAAFDDIPDPRANNARHDLAERLVVAFAVLCGATCLTPRCPPSAAQSSVFSGTS